jgi:ferritin-like metal-binding protein YciE
MARYGAVRTWATELGHRMPRSPEAYAPKEKAADELLTPLAAAGVNKKAT